MFMCDDSSHPSELNNLRDEKDSMNESEETEMARMSLYSDEYVMHSARQNDIDRSEIDLFCCC